MTVARHDPSFRAIAQTIVPEASSLTEDEWREVSAIIGDYLRQKPATTRRQVKLLLTMIDLLPLLRYGRRFRSLSPASRLALLERLQSSRMRLLRRGIWGLRTLVFMGYYGRPAAGAAIGYRADPRGWAARR